MRKYPKHLQCGFKGGRTKQGGWIQLAIMAASAIFGAISSRKAQKQAKKDAELDRQMRLDAIKAADPYGPYRAAAAAKLNALTPESVVDTPEWKSRTLAASRLMASQGYTGSGNAIVAAADAGASAYQQAFSNLAMLSGASANPGAGYAAALSGLGDNSGQLAANNAMGGALDSLGYAAGRIGGSIGTGNTTTPTTTPTPTLGDLGSIPTMRRW